MNLVARAKSAYSKTRFANPDSAARHVSLIAGGTVLAQAVGILTMPIVSRIYSPSDYGIMAVYTSVLAILTELSGFRYYLAIPLPKDERYAKALVALSLGIQISFVLLLSALLFFAGENILIKLSMSQLTPYRLLLPIGLLAAGSYIVLTQWAIREKLFSTIARTKITQSVSGAFAKIALGLMGVRPLGLLIGAIVAQGGGITTLSRSLLKKKGVPRPQKGEVRRVALRYRKFPMYGTWSGIFITTGGRIANLVFVMLYSTQIAGLFAMAQQLLGVPSTFVGQAIGQVFIQRGSVAKRDGNLASLFAQTSRSLMKIGFFPILLSSCIAPYVFSWLLGEQWARAGIFAGIISPWVAINFVYSPLSHVFSIMERQKTGLAFEFLHLPLRIGSLWIGARYGSDVISLFLFMLVNLGVYMLKLAYLNHITGNSFKTLFTGLLREFLSSSILLTPPLLALKTGQSLLCLVFVVGLSSSIYALLLVRSLRPKF